MDQVEDRVSELEDKVEKLDYASREYEKFKIQHNTHTQRRGPTGTMGHHKKTKVLN